MSDADKDIIVSVCKKYFLERFNLRESFALVEGGHIIDFDFKEKSWYMTTYHFGGGDAIPVQVTGEDVLDYIENAEGFLFR